MIDNNNSEDDSIDLPLIDWSADPGFLKACEKFRLRLIEENQLNAFHENLQKLEAVLP